MRMAKPASVRDYLAAQPPAARRALTRVRAIVRKAMPKAEEVISYGIPAYRLGGRVALYFAGWKEHYSLYPADARLVAAFEKELAPYERSKGTVRFPLSEPVPERLIARIARFKAKEAAERAAAGRPSGRRRK